MEAEPAPPKKYANLLNLTNFRCLSTLWSAKRDKGFRRGHGSVPHTISRADP